MNLNPDVMARSPDDQSGRRGNLSDGRDCFASLAMTTRMVARELLPVLILLYPLLLLLDDLEPGFVRSVVNPHWFLLALIVVGMIAGRVGSSLGDSPYAAPPPTPPLEEGEKRKAVLVLIAAIAAGLWVWWRVGGGRIGVIVGFLTAVAVAGVVIEVGEKRSGRT